MTMRAAETLTVRRFRREDAPAVAALEAACLVEACSERAYEKLAEDGNSVGVVALLGREVVGFCSLTNVSGEGEIYNVATALEHRGQGIATAMLEELLRQGEVLGVLDYTLEVRAGNAVAIHLYEKLGFLGEGVRPRFYQSPAEDALIMWKRSSPAIPTTF